MKVSIKKIPSNRTRPEYYDYLRFSKVENRNGKTGRINGNILNEIGNCQIFNFLFLQDFF